MQLEINVIKWNLQEFTRKRLRIIQWPNTHQLQEAVSMNIPSRDTLIWWLFSL